ncbi:MAG: c-type cytochrome [Gemmatimonadales bacterium]|nr:c-type cytochrome [Gemmatimonadales bacterium]
MMTSRFGAGLRSLALSASCALVSVIAARPAVAQASADWNKYQASIKQVPRDTISQNAYTGWKQYELNCSRCHGEFGVGSSFAPALIVSLKNNGTIPDQGAFIQVVCGGRKEKGMPAWCEAGLEMDKMLAMYEYLKGRADGKVGAGRPAVKPEG